MTRLVAEIESKDGMVRVQVRRTGAPSSPPIASFSCEAGAIGIVAFARIARLVIGGLLGDTTDDDSSPE